MDTETPIVIDDLLRARLIETLRKVESTGYGSSRWCPSCWSQIGVHEYWCQTAQTLKELGAEPRQQEVTPTYRQFVDGLKARLDEGEDPEVILAEINAHHPHDRDLDKYDVRLMIIRELGIK